MAKAFIHPTAAFEGRAGENTKIWHFVQVCKNATLGKDCIVGKGVYIGPDVKIGNGVKIQNFCSVYKGVEIEDDVFVGPHVTFTNDKFPRASNRDWKIIETKVEKGASIGANSTILCGITIGKFAMVAAGSVVTKDVPDFALVRGNPARLEGFVDESGKKVSGVHGK